MKRKKFLERKLNLAPTLMWNRTNNEIYKVKLYDSDFPEKDLRHTMRRTWVGKTNCFLIDYKAPALCEAYEAGKLKGKLKEVASRLKDDDNGIFAIYKIK